ncbi:MAG: septum formation initiator family protein [Tissierellales bacterium]
MVKRKKRKKIRLVHLIILALALYLGITYLNQQKMINALKSERLQKQQEKQELDNEIEDIEEKLKYTDSLEYIEKMAREELKMVKPDEIIIIDRDRNKD